MPFDLSMTAEDGVLRVRVTGTVEPPSSAAGYTEPAEIGAMCAAHSCRGVLLDVSEVTLKIGMTARFQGVAGLARGLPLGTRLAVLGLPPALKADVFPDTVAENRGLSWRAFDEEDEALAWLRRPR